MPEAAFADWAKPCLFFLPAAGEEVAEAQATAPGSGTGAGASEAMPAVRPGRDEERQAENRDR